MNHQDFGGSYGPRRSHGIAVALWATLFAGHAGAVGFGGRLNDTGQTTCVDVSSSRETACSGQGQDGDWGRDVTAPGPTDGVAGFSFVKIGADGTPLRAGAVQWSCVYDRVTHLVWEVKTADGGLRDVSRVYTNFGDGRTDDASEFVAAVNAVGLCGYSDWRLPARTELLGLANFGQGQPGPAIDLSWFPNTRGSIYESPDGGYWTGTNYTPSGQTSAWYVHFLNGFTNGLDRSRTLSVRLVRTGP